MSVTGSATTWKTSDGKTFDSEATAKTHANGASVTVKVNGSKTIWTTSDGKSFSSEAEAKTHAESAPKRQVTTTDEFTTWQTSDGKTFYSKVEAEQYLKNNMKKPTIAGTQQGYKTTDGKYFSELGDAYSYLSRYNGTVLDNTTTTARKETVTVDPFYYEVIHDEQQGSIKHTVKLGKTYHKAGWYETYLSYPLHGKPDEFRLSVDADIAGDLCFTLNWGFFFGGKVYFSEPFYTYDAVLDNGMSQSVITSPAYIENVLSRDGSKHEVTRYYMDNGVSFASLEEAQAYVKAHSTEAEVDTNPVTVWKTSDGQAFATEAGAKAHAAAATVSVQVSGATTAYLTSDGQSFASEAEARTHAAKLSVSVAVSTHDVYHDAVTHEVRVDEQGHWQLVDSETPNEDDRRPGSNGSETQPGADGGEQQPGSQQPGTNQAEDDKPGSGQDGDVQKPVQAKHEVAAQKKGSATQASPARQASTKQTAAKGQDASKALPQTGDASALGTFVTTALAGLASIAAGITARRKHKGPRRNPL